MKGRKSTILAVAALLVLTSATVSLAQGGGRGNRGNRGGFGGFGGAQGGAGFQGGPGQRGMNGLNIVDPSRSAVMQLLQRDDVRTELLITAQQREQLDALRTSSQQELQTKMREAFQNMRQQQQNGQGNPNNNVDPNADPATQRQQRRQQMQTTMQSVQTSVQEDQDKQLAKILTPKQLQRLHELDLQWRGPMALVDPKVGDPFMLTPQEHTTVTSTEQDYRQAQRDAMRTMFAGMPGFGRRGQGNANGAQANPNAPNGQPNANAQPQPPPTQEELQARRDAAQKQIDKALKTDGDKVLAALTPEQKQHWTQLLGRPFTFRLVN